MFKPPFPRWLALFVLVASTAMAQEEPYARVCRPVGLATEETIQLTGPDGKTTPALLSTRKYADTNAALDNVEREQSFVVVWDPLSKAAYVGFPAACYLRLTSGMAALGVGEYLNYYVGLSAFRQRQFDGVDAAWRAFDAADAASQALLGEEQHSVDLLGAAASKFDGMRSQLTLTHPDRIEVNGNILKVDLTREHSTQTAHLVINAAHERWKLQAVTFSEPPPDVVADETGHWMGVDNSASGGWPYTVFRVAMPAQFEHVKYEAVAPAADIAVAVAAPADGPVLLRGSRREYVRSYAGRKGPATAYTYFADPAAGTGYLGPSHDAYARVAGGFVGFSLYRWQLRYSNGLREFRKNPAPAPWQDFGESSHLAEWAHYDLYALPLPYYVWRPLAGDAWWPDYEIKEVKVNGDFLEIDLGGKGSSHAVHLEIRPAIEGSWTLLSVSLDGKVVDKPADATRQVVEEDLSR